MEWMVSSEEEEEEEELLEEEEQEEEEERAAEMRGGPPPMHPIPTLLITTTTHQQVQFASQHFPGALSPTQQEAALAGQLALPELLGPLMGELRRLKEQQNAATAAAQAAATATAVAAAVATAGRKPPLPPAAAAAAAAAMTASGRKVTLNPRFSSSDMAPSLSSGGAAASAMDDASVASWGEDGALLGGGWGAGKKNGKRRARTATILTEGVRQAFIKYMRGNSTMSEQSAHMFAGTANALVYRVLAEARGDRVAATAMLDLAGLQQVVCRHFDVFERHTRNAYANLPRIWKLLHGFVAHYAATARQQGVPLASTFTEEGGGGGGSVADGESGSDSESDYFESEQVGGGKAPGAGGKRRYRRKKAGAGAEAEQQQKQQQKQQRQQQEEERVVAHEEDDDSDYDLRGIIFGLPPKPKPRHYGGGSKRKRGGGGAGAGAGNGYGGFPGLLSSLAHDGTVGPTGRKPQTPIVLAQEARMGFIGWMALNTANRGSSILTILRAVNNFLARTLPRCPGGEACLETLLPLPELRALVERHEATLVQEVLRGTNSSLRTFWRHFANFLRESQAGAALAVFVAAAESLESGDLASLPAPNSVPSATAAGHPFILPLSASYDAAELRQHGGGGGGGVGNAQGGNGGGNGSVDVVSSSANSVASTASMDGARGLAPGPPSGPRVAYFDVGGAFYQAGARRRHKKGSGAYAAMVRRSIKQLREEAAAGAEAEARAGAAMGQGHGQRQGQQHQQEEEEEAGLAGGEDEEDQVMELALLAPLASPRGELTAAGAARGPTPEADMVDELQRQRVALSASKRAMSNVLDQAARDGFMEWMQTNTKMQPVSMVTALRTAQRVLANMLVQQQGLPAASQEYSLEQIRAFVQEHQAAFLEEVGRTANVSVKTFWRHFLKYCMGDEAVARFNQELFALNARSTVGELPGIFDGYASPHQHHHHHHQAAPAAAAAAGAEDGGMGDGGDGAAADEAAAEGHTLSPSLLSRFQQYLREMYNCEPSLTPVVAQEVADRTRELAYAVGEEGLAMGSPQAVLSFLDRHQTHPLVAREIDTFKRLHDFCRAGE
jgi:hypothetical protein